MALNVKQKPRYTRWRCATLRFWHSLVTQKKKQVFTRLSNHTKKTWIFQAPAAPMRELLFCWMRKDAGSVDATGVYSSSLRMCARQDCFVFESPQVVFYCNFSSSRHEQKRQSHWSDSFWRGASNQKNEPEFFFLKTLLRVAFFASCAHSHWRPLFRR